MCQSASLQASMGLAHRSAPSDTSSLLQTFVVLDFDFPFTGKIGWSGHLFKPIQIKAPGNTD
jgi:hypothetical protein